MKILNDEKTKTNPETKKETKKETTKETPKETTKETTKKESFFSLDENKENLQKLDSEAKEQKEQPEKKETRGRKKKGETEKENENKIFGSTVSKLGTYSFGLLITRLFPNQPLTPEEEQALNESVEAVAIKYVGILGNYKEEAGLALALSFIILPRYLAQKEEKKKEAEKNLDENN